MGQKTGLWPMPNGTGRPKGVFLVLLMLSLVASLAFGASAALAAGPATVVDSGFESGTDGAALSPSAWTLSGTPQRAEYDTTRAKNGTLSGWIVGPTTAAVAGVSTPVVMTSDGSEYRFWVYADTANENRYVSDSGSVFELRLNTTGQVAVYTKRTATGYAPNAYTAVGTYAAGWTEYRVVLDFTGDTYTLFKRSNATDVWTPLKSSTALTYAVPMREATDRTTTANLLFRSYGNANLWIDDVAYADGGIVDADTTPPAAPATLSASDRPADTGGAINLSWAAATDNVGVTGYRVYRGTVAGSYGAPTTLGNVTSYTDSAATTGTRYYYAVAAVDAAGNEGAKSPESSAIAVDNSIIPPSGFDGTFESGTDGASLTPAWTLSGAPQKTEYDSARAKNGTLSGWIVGPTTAAAAGASVPAVMTSDGAEYRFWMYADSANENRYVSDTGSVFELRTDTTGKLLVYTKRTATGYTANAYTAVGTYAVGWAEYRIVLDFTGDTYTLFKRSNAGDAWTPLKSATAPTYAIPMREATDRTTTANILFRGYTNADLWVDDLTYSDSGIVEADTTPPSAPLSSLAVDRPADTGGAINVSWPAATDNVGVTGYKLYRGTTPGIYGAPTALGNVTTYTDATAVTGTRYYYAVSAVDAAGNEGAKSPESSAIALDNSAPGPDTTPPTAPATLSAVDRPADSGGAINLSWAAATDNVGVTGYKLYRGTAAGIYGTPTTLGNVTSYTDAAATTGTRYYYAVSAIDAAGNEGAKSPESSAIAVDNSVTPPAGFDGTFENAADGAALTANGWTLSGAPQRAEYDTARAKNGTRSGWIQGPTTAAAAGASVPAVMTSNGAEYRFWMYADTVNENRYITDTGSVFELRTDTTGKVLIYTKRTAAGYTANAYTAVGTYAVGWAEYRVVLDFTGDTYTLYSRTNAASAWTPLKSAGASTYAIPMREATDRTTTANWLFRGYTNADLWLDDVRFSNTGFVDPPPVADMPITPVDCSNCHAGMDHGEGPNCGDCHDISEGHPGTPSDMHTPADVTGCTPCHNASLTIEHNTRTPDAGGAFTCNTCHESTDPLVTAAIAAGNSACSACHLNADHASVHAFTAASDANASGDAGCTNSGSGCHGTDPTRATFTTYHPSSGCTLGACHTSPSKPTYVGSGDCQSCHDSSYLGAPARANLATQHYNGTTHTAASMTATIGAGGSASAACDDCHDAAGGLAGQHTGITPVAGSPYGTTVACVECHSDTRANGNAQVLANWTTNACADCHTVTSSAPQHGTTAPVVNTTSSANCGNSGSGCHPSYDVHALHKDAAGGCAISGCHDYTVQGAKPALKTCGQAGGCHVTAGVDFHTAYAAKHTAAATTRCFNASCHPVSRTLDDVHSLYVGSGGKYSQYATTCELCHDNDNSNRVDWATATVTCTSCHAKYHSVPVGEPELHADGDTGHTPTAASDGCAECHSGTLLTVHGEKYAEATACVNCHPIHGAPSVSCPKCHQAKDTWTKTADCVSCHSTTNPHPNADAAHTANPASQTVTISGDTFGPVECADCHELPLLTDIHTGSCSQCHATLLATLTPSWNKSCVQGGCHTATSSAPMHASIDASHAPVAGQTCYASGCHPATATDSLAKTHENASAELGGQVRTSCQVCHWNGTPASRECSSCHADKVDGTHGFNAAQHTGDFGTDAMAGTWTMALMPTVNHAGQALNAPLNYNFGCVSCHDVRLDTEHVKASSAPANAKVCDDCHPTPRDTLTAAWDKKCATAGCHTVAGQEPHATTATLADHAVADSVKAEGNVGLGCSASPGAVAGGYQRTPCHTTDLIQEHNRKIGGFDPFPTQVIGKTIAVTCEQCHASAGYLAVAASGGGWDGTCNACHDGVAMENHSIVGSARYNAVHALHQAPRYYDSGTYNYGVRKEGINSMDAHGPVRTSPDTTKPVGCAGPTCHTQFYIEAGLSSYYPANACATCHGPNIAPLPVYQGSFMWKSGGANNLNTGLTLAVPGTLPAASSLDFKTYYDIETDWDYGYAQVSTDGGSTWTNLPGNITTTVDTYGENLGNGITGNSDGQWVDAHFDLSAYAGQTVRIRLSYITDGGTFGDGWLVDLVTVGPAGAPVFSDDVETLKPEWTITSSSTTVKWTR